MSKEKKTKDKKAVDSVSEKIKRAVEGLYYTSETDAEISAFKGNETASVTKEVLLAQTGGDPNSAVEERKFEEFFRPLTELQNWYGDEERQTAQKFSKLRDLLESELRDLKVFKIGQIEKDIYAVGLDSKNILTGIKTNAVET